MGTSGKVHLLHGVFKIAFALGVELAALADLLRAHGGIGGELGGFKTRYLDLPRGGDSFADHGGGLAGDGVGGELAEIDERHLNVDVDPIQQRAGDALAVVLDLADGAAALAFRIAVESARVRIPF